MNIKKLAVFIALTVLVTCFIFYNSLKNSYESNKASDVIVEVVEPIVEELVGEDEVDVNYFVRKGAHITEFSMLGIVIYLLVLEVKKSGKHLLGYGLFYVLAVAVTDEYIQSFSDRTSSVIDVMIDFSGAVSGLAVITLAGLISTIVKENKSRKGNQNGDQN